MKWALLNDGMNDKKKMRGNKQDEAQPRDGRKGVKGL